MGQSSKRAFLFLWRRVASAQSTLSQQKSWNKCLLRPEDALGSHLQNYYCSPPASDRKWMAELGAPTWKKNGISLFFLPQLSLNSMATGKGPRGRQEESIIKAHYLHVGGPQMCIQRSCWTNAAIILMQRNTQSLKSFNERVWCN